MATARELREQADDAETAYRVAYAREKAAETPAERQAARAAMEQAGREAERVEAAARKAWGW